MTGSRKGFDEMTKEEREKATANLMEIIQKRVGGLKELEERIKNAAKEK